MNWNIRRGKHTHTHQNRGRWHILASLQIGTHVLTANELEMEAGIFKGCKKGDRLAVIRQVGPRDKTLWMVLRRDCHQCCRHGSSLSSLALPLVSVCDAVVVRPLLHLIFLIFPAHHRCRFNHPEILVLHLHRQHRQRHYLLLFLFLLSFLSSFLLFSLPSCFFVIWPKKNKKKWGVFYVRNGACQEGEVPVIFFESSKE